MLQASALLLMVAIFWIAIRLYDREKAVRFEDAGLSVRQADDSLGPVHAGGAEGDGAGALPGAPASDPRLSPTEGPILPNFPGQALGNHSE